MNRYSREANFVPALREPEPQRPIVVDVNPREIVTLPPAAMTQSEVRGTYVDRAKAFQVATLPISAAFGVGALIMAVVGWSVPAFSLVGLLVFWAAFLAWWLVGWLIHHLFSADGLALLHVVLGWNYLRREQAERFRRYRERW